MKAQASFEKLELPYFVYGTLRPGFGNDFVWLDNFGIAAFDGEVRARGFIMVGQGVPYAVRTYDLRDSIVGALIYPGFEFEERGRLRYALDRLEAHPVHYERIEVDVECPNGVRHAWIYTPTAWTPMGRPVPTGDWADVRSRRNAPA